MGILQETGGQGVSYLEAQHWVGRSERCQLRLPAKHISSVHATLLWSGGLWRIKDRGSRNGTFLNGTRIEPQLSQSLLQGDRLSFGGCPHQWELVDATAPKVMAVPVDGGNPLVTEQGMLSISSKSNLAYAFRDETGAWLLERDGETLSLANGQQVEVGERMFRICLPDPTGDTATVGDELGTVRDLSLHFDVSANEEHIELRGLLGGVVHPLGARAHNFLLLHLSRHRNQDHQAHRLPSEQGWMSLEQLLTDLRVEPERLRTDVYRIRRQFAELPLLDPGNILQRRAATRELRIGTVQPAVIGSGRDP